MLELKFAIHRRVAFLTHKMYAVLKNHGLGYAQTLSQQWMTKPHAN